MTAAPLFHLTLDSLTLPSPAWTDGRAPLASFAPSERLRLKILCTGKVQGVGFRPFVYRLATAHTLAGKTQNIREGVWSELEGTVQCLNGFLKDFFQCLPSNSRLSSFSIWQIPLETSPGFLIEESLNGDGLVDCLPSIPPDLAPCDVCAQELFSPSNRRYLYPFISCSACGPRFSILRALPYDRENTTLREFLLCEDCLKEYHDPLDRRFHAQPIACPTCGPQLEWHDASGKGMATGAEALERALEAIRLGKCIALLGVGGFQLLVDAQNEAAVERLRHTKGRPEKPFALMVRDLSQVRQICHLSDAETSLLTSPGTPIVLLRRISAERQVHCSRNEIQDPSALNPILIAPNVAPFLENLGILLPASPLHLLLMHRLDGPVVCTSGNRSGEPLCTTLEEGIARLGSLVDGFLSHNRPIARPLDDSVVRVIEDRPQFFRVARGFSPLLFQAPSGPDGLGLGGHLKTSVALRKGNLVMVGPHIGDLETVLALEHHTRSARDLVTLCHVQPSVIARDLHPDHASGHTAIVLTTPHPGAPDAPKGTPPRVVSVQHHEAHARACLLEHSNVLSAGPALAVVWDGAGDGGDGTLFGGEFFRLDIQQCQRVVSLFPFRLPGGSRAFIEPARCALGLLSALALVEPEASASPADTPKHPQHSEALNRLPFSLPERTLLLQLLQRGVQSPQTSSMGRLFDGVAALLNVSGSHAPQTYEGQIAIQLEQLASQAYESTTHSSKEIPNVLPYPAPSLLPPTAPGEPQRLDWRPFVAYCLGTDGESKSLRALNFHRWLVDAIVLVAQSQGLTSVVLTGGCFQNRHLLKEAIQRIRQAGGVPYWPQRLPPNDGGLSAGQVMSPEFR